MYALKRYGSTWTPSGTAVTAYALRKISSSANRMPKHAGTFRQTDLSRRRRLRPTRILKTANALRAKNTRLIGEMKVVRNELKAARHSTRRTECERHVDTEYAVLHDELVALAAESTEMSARGTGDGKFADRVRQHLAEVATFFNGQMSTINAADSTRSTRHRTVMSEALRRAFIRNVTKMNEWIVSLVEMDELPALD